MGEKRVIEQVASNDVYIDDWFLKDSPTQDTSKISATNLKAILGADGTLALEEIANAIAEEYDSTHTYYNTGLVFHEGVLYQCTATSTTGTWDSTKWNVVDIKDLLDNVSTNIGYLWNTISNTIAGNYDTSSTYNTGDYVIYSLKLYRCKDDGVTGAWNSSKWDEVNIPEYIDYVLANAGKVDDVKVDGTSVVTNKVAEIEIPVKDVQVKTDSTYDSVVDASGNAKIDLSSVTAYGSVSNLPQAIATFKDGADAPMKSLKVAIEPQQDLHGYDSPWVGGAGKNLFDKPNLVMNKAIPAGTTIYGQIFGVTASFKLYGYDEENTEYEVMSLSINKNSTTTTRAYVRLEISQSALNALGNGNLMVSLSDFTRFEPYSNICPISGWDKVDVNVSGVNVWDEEWEVGGLNPLNGETTSENDRIRSKNYRPCKPNMTMFYYIPSGKGNLQIVFYDINKNFLGYYNFTTEHTFTTPNGCYFFKFNTGGSYGTTYNNDISINYPSTDTEYHAYNGHTYTIDLDGTRYGGEVDVVSGVMTVDRAMVNMGDLYWNYDSGSQVFSAVVVGIKNGVYTDTNLISSLYPVKPISYSQFEYGMRYNSPTSIGVKDSRYTDATAFKTAVTGQQLVYELATPLTIQLTPTAVKSLLGQNNVWADTGDINDCVYRRDMSSTIDDIIARLEALENA